MSTEQKTYPSQFEKVKAITDQLEAGIQALFESDKFKQYLKTLSKFHDYSLNNTILIAMQKPDATLVAGYTAWQKQFGRQVQKGENGIRILAPTPYKKRMEVEKTDPVTGEIRIAIQEGMSQVQTVKTAIHEMTHQKLHSIDPTIKVDPLEPKLTRNHKEVEAESVAFTVCQHYGIDTGDYSFAYVAGWSHGKETPELKASLDKIRKTASEMITEIDEHLAVLQKEYAWAHLTADDVKNIECIGSEYMPHSRMAEHTFSCEIVGEPMTLKLTVSQYDDGEGFTIHSEGKDIWDAMPESELRKLEPVLTSTAELHYWTSQVEKAETAEAVKEVSFGFMETENLGLSREQCQKFWEVVDQKESSLSPPSALADLQAKKEKSEKEMSSKPKTKASQKKSKKQKKEESR